MMRIRSGSVILLQRVSKARIGVWPAIHCRPWATLEHGFDVLAGQRPVSFQGVCEREHLATILLQQRLHPVQHLPEFVLDPVGTRIDLSLGWKV